MLLCLNRFGEVQVQNGASEVLAPKQLNLQEPPAWTETQSTVP